jgi:hypothetical protein
LAERFDLQATSDSSYDLLRPISHAAATVTLLRAGYTQDAELLLGRPITHCAPAPNSPLLVCGTATLLARLAAQLPAERGPTPGTNNTRLYDRLRVQSVGPDARRIGMRSLGRARLRPGVTVGQLLRRGMSRRRLSEAARQGWITLAEPTA